MIGGAMEPEAIIGRIMERHGGRSTLEEFHRAVNVTFREFESEICDRELAGMWESLPRQLALPAGIRIPKVEPLLNAVRKLQADGGVFLHLQDPNGEFIDDAELRYRMSWYSRRILPEWLSRFTPRRVLKRIHRELAGQQRQDCVSGTNLFMGELSSVPPPRWRSPENRPIEAKAPKGLHVGAIWRLRPAGK
jgi:hypothetical protein